MSGCNEKIGPQGPMGLPGAKGNTGASGPMGLQGPQGPAGLQGLNGAKGDKGDKGDTGLDGAKGDTGPAGIPGKDGAEGPKGINGTDGALGAKGDIGPQGPQGSQGAQGVQGLQGIQGVNGRYILGAYNDLTGIGNSSALGDETLLFSQNLAGNTLLLNGDEIELFIHTEYFANDLVNIIFDMDGANRYTYAYQNADDDIRFIKIKIARINSVSQFWTIEDVCKTILGPVTAIKTIETFTTTFDLKNPMSFEIFADNIALGADQVVLKKAVMYLNKIT